MSLGFVEIDGRRYRIKYKDPDESDIDSEFKKLKNSAGPNYNQELDKDRFMARARTLAASKKYEKASREAYRYATKIVAKLDELKAEPGISQRRTATVSVEGASDGVLKSIELVNTKDSDPPNVIADDKVKKSLETLVDKLNKSNYDHQQSSKTPKEDTFLKIPIPEYSKPIHDQIEDLAYWFAGAGDKDHQFALEMTRLNRFNKSMLPANRELVGYTFITRPHCNLANENLANVRDFAPLLFCSPNSIQMAIRQSLDTEFAYHHGGEDKFKCPLIDIQNPFFVMCCNSLRSCNGFPDPTLAIETTEGGFFSEQQSGVIGYDRMAKGQDLQLTFRDYIGAPVMSAIDFWVKYMGYVQDGTMHQYKEDIEHNLFGYSVSIYRFLLDYSGRRITRWAKATGCWPKMSPMGTIFNVAEGETVVNAARDNFSVPFQASVFEYNDPEILRDFNILVRRYCANIADGEPTGGKGDGRDLLPDLRTHITNNRAGIPYVTFRYGAPELIWKVPVGHSSGNGTAVNTPAVGNADYKEPKDPDNDYLKFPH